MQGKISWKFWTAQWGFGERRKQSITWNYRTDVESPRHFLYASLLHITREFALPLHQNCFTGRSVLSHSVWTTSAVLSTSRPCVFPSCSPPPPFLSLPLSLCFSSTWAGNVIYTWMNKFLYVNILRQKRNGIVNILWGDGMSFSFLSSLFFFPLSHLWWC